MCPMEPTLASCPCCGTAAPGPSPVSVPIEGGCELDGRPLRASDEALQTWRRRCATCELEWPSLEAVRELVDGGRPDQAVQVAIEASWVLDKSDPQEADRCRAAALWLLRRRPAPDPMLVTELCRRLGKFDSAVRTALREQAASGNPAVAAVLGTQIALAQRGDRSRCSMVDAVASATAP